MAIRIKHDPIATPIIAAYATGVGNAQERRRKDSMQMVERQQDRMHQTGMAFQKNQWDMEADERRFGNQADLQQTQLDYWRERDKADAATEDARRKAEFVQRGLHDGTLGYTPEQKAEFEKINADLATSNSSLVLRPEYKEELRTKAEEARQKILMNPQPKMWGEEPPSMEDQLRSKIPNYEQYKDLPWVLDDKGQPQLPRGWKMPEDAEQKRSADSQKQLERLEDRRDKLSDSMAKMESDLRKEKNPITGKNVYPETKIKELVDARYSADLQEIEQRSAQLRAAAQPHAEGADVKAGPLPGLGGGLESPQEPAAPPAPAAAPQQVPAGKTLADMPVVNEGDLFTMPDGTQVQAMIDAWGATSPTLQGQAGKAKDILSRPPDSWTPEEMQLLWNIYRDRTMAGIPTGA